MERPKSAKHNAERGKKSAYVNHKRINRGVVRIDQHGNTETNSHMNVNSPLSYNSDQLHHHHHQMQHINAQSHGYILQNGNTNNTHNGSINEYDLISVATPNNNINGQQQAFVEIADSIVIRQRKEQRFQTSKSAVCER